MPRGVRSIQEPQAIAPISEFINTHSYGEVRNGRDNIVGDSVANEYIPFYSLFKGTGYTYSNTLTQESVRVYFSPYTGQCYSTNRYDTLFEYFSDYFSIKRKDDIYATKGFMFDCPVVENMPTKRPLMLLALKGEYAFKINKDNIDYSQFILLINNAFEANHRLVFNRVSKDILPSFKENGIDLVFTNDINKWCFKKTDLTPKFKSVSEMRQYTQSLNNVLHA